MPVVDGVAAADAMLGIGVCTPGYCLAYVWQGYAAVGATSAQTYPTAYSAWLGSSGQNLDDNPPAGVPVYFGPRAGSSAGDVVISLGDRQCVATDWPRNGVIGVVSLADRQRQIGRPYLGWADNMIGNPIGNLDMPLSPQDKQIIKDAMLEFFRDVTTPPGGMRSWPFFDVAVWNAPVVAQDRDGYPITGDGGAPVTYAASGYLAATNAQVRTPMPEWEPSEGDAYQVTVEADPADNAPQGTERDPDPTAP